MYTYNYLCDSFLEVYRIYRKKLYRKIIPNTKVYYNSWCIACNISKYFEASYTYLSLLFHTLVIHNR